MSQGRQYITVMDWMWDDLGLTGNDILVYAMIYGFSQDGSSEFKGSANYVAQRLHIRKATALDILRRLTDRGVIKKREFTYQGKRYCFYSAEPVAGVGTETVPGRYGNRTCVGTETVPNNKRDNKKDISPLTPQGEGTADPPELEELEPELREAVRAWLSYKTERRQAYKPTGLQALITRVRRKAAAYSPEAVTETIYDSMANGYQGIMWQWLRPEKTQAEREEVQDW